MKDIVIKKLKPQFTTVITTLDCYAEDYVMDGLIVAPKGTLKLYQRVISVGENVKNIHEGDLVLLNLTNYIERKFKENSLKEDMEQMEDIVRYNFPKLIIDGHLYGKFQDRDIEGVIEEFEEIEVQTSTLDNKLL
jgi:hypothetical protein